MSNIKTPTHRPRRTWLIPTIVAFVLFIGGVASNLVATDLEPFLKPYRLVVWGIFAIALLAAIIAAMREARQSDEPLDLPNMTSMNSKRNVSIGGDVNNSSIITGSSNVMQQGEGNIHVDQAQDVIINQAPPEPQLPTFTPVQIHRGCGILTHRLANELIANRPVIRREHIQAQLDAFLNSFNRYCLLLGPSGVGKSTVMAVEAGRLLERGWAALLMRAQHFSLEYLAEMVAQNSLGLPTIPNWRQVVSEPWKGELPSGLQGFILLIHALDEADPSKISRELLKLHDGLGQIPPSRVKVIASCRELTWDRLSQQLPF